MQNLQLQNQQGQQLSQHGELPPWPALANLTHPNSPLSTQDILNIYVQVKNFFAQNPHLQSYQVQAWDGVQRLVSSPYMWTPQACQQLFNSCPALNMLYQFNPNLFSFLSLIQGEQGQQQVQGQQGQQQLQGQQGQLQLQGQQGQQQLQGQQQQQLLNQPQQQLDQQQENQQQQRQSQQNEQGGPVPPQLSPVRLANA